MVFIRCPGYLNLFGLHYQFRSKMWAGGHAQRFEVFTSQRSPSMQIHLMFPMGNNLGVVPGYTRGKYKSKIQITLPTNINQECTTSRVVALARLHP